MQRQELLHREVQRMEAQLADGARTRLYQTPSAYAAWRSSASKALAYLRREHELLSEWLDRHSEDGLLSQAHELLCVLREEVDLDPHEVDLIERIGRFLASPTGGV